VPKKVKRLLSYYSTPSSSLTMTSTCTSFGDQSAVLAGSADRRPTVEAKDSDKGIAYGSPWVSALTPHVPFRLTRDGVDRAVGVGENSRESSELAEGGSTFSWCQYILFTHQSIVGVLPRGLTHPYL